METKVMRWTSTILRLLAGGLFIVTGVLKAIDPAAFLKAIENYQILPHLVALITAYLLPYLEIFCGLGLVFKRLYAGALIWLTGLMLVFMAALISAWARGLNIDCGCFGSVVGHSDYPLALARDFLILAVFCFLLCRQLLEWRPASK